MSQDVVLSQLTGSLLQVTQSSDQSVAGPPYREVRAGVGEDGWGQERQTQERE